MSSGGFLYRKESDLWRKTLRWLGSYEVPAASFRAWDLAKPSLMKCNKPRYSYPPNSSVKPQVSIHSLSPFSIAIERGYIPLCTSSRRINSLPQNRSSFHFLLALPYLRSSSQNSSFGCRTRHFFFLTCCMSWQLHYHSQLESLALCEQRQGRDAERKYEDKREEAMPRTHA